MSYRQLESLTTVPKAALDAAITLSGIRDTHVVNDIVASIFHRWRYNRKDFQI